MLDEGYIKFQAHWVEKPPFLEKIINELGAARQTLYQNKLIGAYENGIGFGNISRRAKRAEIEIKQEEDAFFITGSATGNFVELSAAHFALVTKVDIQKNTLFCEGPIIASSESMSHGVIYRECPEVQAVVHIHDLDMWKALMWKVPTTAATATYGTPEMANSIVDLLKNTDLRRSKLFVMSGHEEGIFSFGETLEEAVKTILDEF